LRVGASQISAPKPGCGTRGLRSIFFQLFSTGLSPSLAGRFRPLRVRWREGDRAHNSTSPASFLARFSLDSSLFARRYSGNPSWFLFLPLLRCFSSGGSPSIAGVSRFPKEPQREVSFGNPRIYDCMRLPEAFRSWLRPSSALKPSHPPDGVAYRA
jgi:hypothetical protein